MWCWSVAKFSPTVWGALVSDFFFGHTEKVSMSFELYVCFGFCDELMAGASVWSSLGFTLSSKIRVIQE